MFCILCLQVSLRPGMKSMKLGSSAGRTNKPAAPTSDASHAYPDGTSASIDSDKTRGKPGLEAKPQKSMIPRTRDDSSDEDDPPPTSRPMGPLLEPALPLLGHTPILPHPFPGHYPPLHPHMMPMQGGPEQFYGPHGGRGIVGPAPLPPHSVGGSGGGLLPHQMPPPQMPPPQMVSGHVHCCARPAGAKYVFNRGMVLFCAVCGS